MQVDDEIPLLLMLIYLFREVETYLSSDGGSVSASFFGPWSGLARRRWFVKGRCTGICFLVLKPAASSFLLCGRGVLPSGRLQGSYGGGDHAKSRREGGRGGGRGSPFSFLCPIKALSL